MPLNVCFVNMTSQQTQQLSEMDDGTCDESEDVEQQPAKDVNSERISTCHFMCLLMYLFVTIANCLTAASETVRIQLPMLSSYIIS